jgi:hypothetical protein
MGGAAVLRHNEWVRAPAEAPGRGASYARATRASARSTHAPRLRGRPTSVRASRSAGSLRRTGRRGAGRGRERMRAWLSAASTTAPWRPAIAWSVRARQPWWTSTMESAPCGIHGQPEGRVAPRGPAAGHSEEIDDLAAELGSARARPPARQATGRWSCLPGVNGLAPVVMRLAHAARALRLTRLDHRSPHPGGSLDHLHDDRQPPLWMEPRTRADPGATAADRRRIFHYLTCARRPVAGAPKRSSATSMEAGQPTPAARSPQLRDTRSA